MNKKLQVFVSSTYTDLIDERQAAVEAILDAGHIPAGMELFKAGKSQIETIKRWIDESDVYMLILGGRYGSVEEESGLSYTELEYRYALSKNMPVFAIVLEESFLFTKAATKGKDAIFEKKHKQKYNQFKKYVETNIVKFVNNIDKISTAIHSQLSDIKTEYTDELCGWVKYTNNKSSFDDENSLLALTKSYNNLLEEYKYISKRFKNLRSEYKKQMIKISNSESEHFENSIEFTTYNNVSPSFYTDDYQNLDKLLKYASTSMYKYRFRIIVLNHNYYCLRADVKYYLEHFFMVIYQLSYCGSPINIFILDSKDRDIFLECISIFIQDNLFKPCNVLDVPTVLTIEPLGHEVYKYLISNPL